MTFLQLVKNWSITYPLEFLTEVLNTGPIELDAAPILTQTQGPALQNRQVQHQEKKPFLTRLLHMLMSPDFIELVLPFLFIVIILASRISSTMPHPLWRGRE